VVANSIQSSKVNSQQNNKLLEETIGDYNVFVLTGLQHLAQVGIDIQGMPIDHIAYRVADINTFDSKKIALLRLSKAWAENEHNGRLIAKFVLRDPIVIDDRQISLIELPSPKPGIHYNNGLEHFEVVTDDNLDNIRVLLESLRKNEKLSIDTSALPLTQNETLSI